MSCSPCVVGEHNELPLQAGHASSVTLVNCHVLYTARQVTARMVLVLFNEAVSTCVFPSKVEAVHADILHRSSVLGCWYITA